MENMLLAEATKSIPESTLFVTFLILVVLYLVCGFVIVCLVSNLGNKLILLWGSGACICGDYGRWGQPRLGFDVRRPFSNGCPENRTWHQVL